MNTKFQLLLVSAALASLSLLAQESNPATPAPKPSSPPDREKASYALGMNIGLLHKRTEINERTDRPLFTQAIKDVLADKPTQLKESEIGPILTQAGAGGLASQSPVEKQKISYALGMRMAAQIKVKYTDADGSVVAQAINDVLAEKPTRLKESEIQPLLQQALVWGKLKQSEKNKADGEAFLAKNAKEPDIKSLPDGLQYRVLTEGAGSIPTTNDQVYVKCQGTFVDGRQFLHHNHYLIRCGGGCPGWQDALPRMKIGSKWRIFVPSDLAFGEEGESAWGVGPNAALIFDLEMLAIAPSDAEFGRGRLGHAFEDSDIPDPAVKDPAHPGTGK
jgi:FKBP-type peptidyl-prolyl cis-trans isomerase FklB